MTTRPARGARGLFLAAAALAALSVTGLVVALDPTPSPTKATATEMVPAAPSTTVLHTQPPQPPRAATASPGPLEESHGGEDEPGGQLVDRLAGPVGDDELNRALRATHRSNLTPTLEQHVLAVAEAALKADLTGKGRDRFPDYLPGSPPPTVYRDVRVQAAVARRIHRPRGTIEATLMWAGTAPNGDDVERQTTRIHLQLHDNGWQPVAAV